MKLADRMSRIGTESAFDVLARARALEAEGRESSISRSASRTSTRPAHVTEAGIQALRDGYTHYVPAARHSTASRRHRRAHLDDARHPRQARATSVVAPGGKPIMFWTIMALCQEGDEVIVPDPSYPIYESMARVVGAKVVPLPMLEGARVHVRARGSGGAPDPEDQAGGLELARQPDRRFLRARPISRRLPTSCATTTATSCRTRSTRGMLYSGEHYSVAAEPDMLDRTIILDGFSKTYAMTGWRLGYGIYPTELIPHIDRLAVNSVSCTNAATQMAGVAALTGPQDCVDTMVAEFEKRRDYIVDGLNAIPGITLPASRSGRSTSSRT